MSAGARTNGPLDVASIANVVRRALLASDLVDDAVADAGAAATAVLRVKGQVEFECIEVGAKGIVRAGVALRIATRPASTPGSINEELSAGGEQPYDATPSLDRQRLGQQIAERTVIDLLSQFLARARLTTAAPAQIHAVITGDGGALRGEAIRLAGARDLRDEIPTLLALLQDDNESLRDAALGALIALRERRAVKVLTLNRSLRDRHEMRKILEAIAILGGEEAGDYLAFVAQSHDDEEIRTLAADAKSRLDRRSDAGSR